MTRVLTHSGRHSFSACPVLACPDGRTTRVQLDFADGHRQVATACERHISLLAARCVARARAMRGEEPLAADG